MIDINTLLNIAKTAGSEILKIYFDENSDFKITQKSDDSPLTKADLAAHQVIMQGLSKHFPDIPIISEEGVIPDYETRNYWTQFFLVDPLDGTKEFINRNGEFTVNIAFIDHGVPTYGVIYQPVSDLLYYGSPEGAFSIKGEELIPSAIQGQPLQVANLEKTEEKKAVRSKSHASIEEEIVLQRFGIKEAISIGSSLKFCLIAEGKAVIYYRHNPTMEWDIAAGHAIVKAAGGEVYQGNTQEKVFQYNKKDLRNGSFLAVNKHYLRL